MAVRHPVSSSHNRSSRPDAPNFSADCGFMPLQQSARRIEDPLRLPTLARVVDMPQRGDHLLADLRALAASQPQEIRI
jgi:hypothetical protein